MIIENKKSGHRQTITPEEWKGFGEKRLATQLPHENMQMAYKVIEADDNAKIPAQLKTTKGKSE